MNVVDMKNEDFNPELYIKILVAVTKADRNNGPKEVNYVKNQANRMGIDFAKIWGTTDKTFSFRGTKISRATAIVIIKDCILLASMDKNFSIGEREKVYTFAAKLDISRSDVDYIVEWLDDYNVLEKKWDRLISGDIH